MQIKPIFYSIVLKIIVIAVAIFIAIEIISILPIATGLQNQCPALFDSIDPSTARVAKEALPDNDMHVVVRVATPGYAQYNPEEPDATSSSFIAALVEKEGWSISGMDVTTYYEYNYYSQSEQYKPWNEYKVWVKWYDEDMTASDMYKIQNDGWILSTKDTNGQSITYSYSVIVGSNILSAVFTFTPKPVSGEYSSASNEIQNGWLYLGLAKNWRYSSGNTYDEYMSKAYMKIMWENKYMSDHDGDKILLKVKVIPWWWYVEFWEDALDPNLWGSDSYYWGLIFTFILGDSSDARSYFPCGNSDVYIYVAPSP